MNPIQFVHVGDTHLHQNARQADRLRALDQIIAEGLALPNLAAWLWPGDLFHQRSTIDDRNALKDRVKRMADAAPVVICYGNHDLPGDLDIFGDLGAGFPIHVVSTPQVVRFQIGGAWCSAFVLPYPTAAGLASEGVAPGDIVPRAYVALEAIFMEAAARLERARIVGDVTLMVGHVNVAGSITSSGQPNIGKEIELDGALLARLGPIYCGLNHIHKAQEIGGAYYAGSICRLDWGEVEPKSYLVAEYEWDATEKTWDLVNVDTPPVNVPAMYHVEGVLSREGFSYEVKAGPNGVTLDKPESWRGCEVRVRARFQQTEKSILDFSKAHLMAEFAEAARLELELVAVPDTAMRSPAVAAARTMTEKIVAWSTETQTALPATFLDVLPLLEHGDADAVIAAEQESMTALLDMAESEMREVA